ncbi:MAG TPA: type II CAAX endopeptidase family protein [Acidimicrobiales bacterium]|nr:type II CAAX endopeptidase family protein [Acidimicrobiales bacterium]
MTDAAEPSRPSPPACNLIDWIAVFFASIVTAVAGSAIGAEIGGSGSLTETAGGLIGLWAAIVPSAILLSRVRGTGNLARDFGLRFERSDWLGVPIGLASQIVLLPLVYGALQLLTDRDIVEELREPAEELTNQAGTDGAFVFLAVLLIVGAPLAEEIFYRGMLFVALRARTTVAITIVVSGFVFAIAHLLPLLIPGLAAFGMVLAWVRARTGRLGMAVVAHATFNAVTVAALA